VFYVKGIISKNKDTVGLYQNEGLGRVIFNPFFLEEGEIAKTKIQFQFKDVFKLDVSEKNDGNIKTELGKFLSKKLESNKKEMEISKKVQHLVYSPSVSVKELIKISPSQWGGVRAYASKASNYDELRKSLFDKDKGYLTHGVADIKYWGRNKGANLKAFKLIFEENAEFGPPFIEKFAAEIAKINKRK
jgi:hypothetical protein